MLNETDLVNSANKLESENNAGGVRLICLRRRLQVPGPLRQTIGSGRCQGVMVLIKSVGPPQRLPLFKTSMGLPCRFGATNERSPAAAFGPVCNLPCFEAVTAASASRYFRADSVNRTLPFRCSLANIGAEAALRLRDCPRRGFPGTNRQQVETCAALKMSKPGVRQSLLRQIHPL